MARQNVSDGGPYEEMYGYSRAVRVGSHIHVSGTTADPAVAAESDVYDQTVSALARIAAALEELGASLADVVRTVTYVTDIGQFENVGRAHKEALGDVRPAATLVEVSALAAPIYLVEIEADAIIDD